MDRAIDGQALIGNVGGYVGLFLGYSILQLPDILCKILKNMKKWFVKLKQARSENDRSVISIAIVPEVDLEDLTEKAIKNETVTILDVVKWDKRNFIKVNANLQNLTTDLKTTIEEVKTIKSSVLEMKESISRIEYATVYQRPDRKYKRNTEINEGIALGN